MGKFHYGTYKLLEKAQLFLLGWSAFTLITCIYNNESYFIYSYGVGEDRGTI
ncbi:hypothetical protein CLCAR_1985 [Clostridium carboxidivorans P7]|nr:hypothetical protein CLCAR_1985 [Clostridium carboxidivorans P7]